MHYSGGSASVSDCASRHAPASLRRSFHVKHCAFDEALQADYSAAHVRRSGDWWRPCRLRSGCGRGAAWRAGVPGELPAGGRRPDVVQPVDRRGRQGPSGARARCVRRADGARRRSLGDPSPDAQPQQGQRGARPASPGRPALVPARDERSARRERGRAAHRRDRADADRGRADHRGRNRRWPDNRTVAPWSSPPGPFSTPGSSAGKSGSWAAARASARRCRWPGKSAISGLARAASRPGRRRGSMAGRSTGRA